MPFNLKAVGSSSSGTAEPIDSAEVEVGLKLLLDPEHGTQLQAIGNGYPIAHFDASDLDGIVTQVKKWNAESPRSIFFKINPVVSGLAGKAAIAGDIVRRRNLFIDVDTERPDEEKDNPASDAEKGGALLVAEHIGAFLRQLGWPEPILSDSGNGWHLYYRIDLANDETSRQAIRAFLKALAEVFDNEAGSVDTSCFNADRYSRVPGSWSRRGVASKSRPWRKCHLVRVPETWEAVSLEAILAATAKLEGIRQQPTEAKTIPTRFVLRAVAAGTSAYVAAAVDGEKDKIAKAGPGTRNNQLFKSAAALAEFVPGGHLTEDDLAAQLYDWACLCGLDRDPGCGPAGIRATIASAFKHGLAQPRELPEKNGTHPSAQETVPPGQSTVIQASKVETRRVEWLMPGRIPLGKLTTLAGQGGLGKTFVLLDIAARLSRGAEWPGDEAIPSMPGRVIFVSGEDDIEDTLVPRLIELQAKLDNVFFLRSEVAGRFTLADLKTLDRAVVDAGPGVKLVCIDPPTAYLGDVNDHSNSELRGLLSPLKDWASHRRIAVVFITHVNKAQGQLDAMARVIGGVAWVNAVRAAHLFARDPEDETKMVFVPLKMNLAKRRNGLAYRIVESGDVAKVEWLGEIETTADEAIKYKIKPRRQLARDWLIERFQEKREWESSELFKAAKEDNVSKNAIYEAKDSLSLPRARRQVSENGDVSWYWWVPPDWHLLKNDCEKI